MYREAIKSDWFLRDLTTDGEKFDATVPGDIHDSLFKPVLFQILILTTTQERLITL